mmetsp:Transcript_11909/g.22030  ORF Transcript_11909/g.22030 Transcript_11909/m.22030 type:complete len:464 (-) Transcript_11909:81-1472(-)
MKMLTVGRYVKIHSLASEKAKKHNGKTAVVKTPLIDEESGRCGVEPVGRDSGNTKRILAIKPSNLTILCSFCKMREEKTEPVPILCERCQKVSYCSESCKKKHWEGVNKESGVPNCHEAWCIPMQFEMEVPTQPILESNVGEQAYEEVSKYLLLAADIGNSGRRNEEKGMLEALLDVDPLQPSAYNNLFISCSSLAVMAERYFPEEYEVLSFKAIRYLTEGIELIISEEVGGMKPDGPKDQMCEAYIDNINHNALNFIDNCMRGERGKGNAKLENIESCLMGILVLFHQRNKPMNRVHTMLGFCLQKLTKYEDAVTEFMQCCKAEKEDKDGTWHHSSLMQIPQCLSCVALYREDKSPSERIEVMEKAVTKFNEAIAMLKEDQKKEHSIHVYRCQSQLCRCLYNKNSILNQFAQRGELPYPDQQKEELYSLMCDTADIALRGAIAAGDMVEVQAIESLKRLPFS